MNIKEASKTAGVTPRTLYYYEEVGLLSPAREENGYRVYSEADVTQARMIRAYRELQFSLDEIRILLTAPRRERDSILEKHIEDMKIRREQLDNRIALAHTIRMVGPERLSELDIPELDAQMLRAHKALNENEEFKRLSEKFRKQTPRETEMMCDEIIQSLAEAANASDAQIEAAVQRLRACIETHFYPCPDETLRIYARAYSGDGILAQALEDAAGPGAGKRLWEKLEKAFPPR